MNIPMRSRATTLCFFLFIAASSAALVHAGEITDMFGRKTLAPGHPNKVFSTSPPVTYMLYAIDPSMLAGLNFPVREWEKKHLRKSIRELPVLGGWFGQGNTPNLEMILRTNPELIVVSKYDSAMNDKVDRAMKTMPMPVVNVKLDSLSDYPAAFLYLGRVLGREERAEKLAAYARQTLSEMSALAASTAAQKRVSVYYAEGVDGLSTECGSSQHAELIPLVGGRNVHNCRAGNLYGMEKISLEQLMLYDPETMLALEKTFYGTVFSDPRWQRIKAVRDRRVYMIPNQPFNWFDRPPSFMRFLGAKWLANLLYPERYRIDTAEETQKFFRLFLDVRLDAQETHEILKP